MNFKDKALVGGLTYKIVIDLIVVIGLLFQEYSSIGMFIMINFIIKISIDSFAIYRIVRLNKTKESE